AWETLLEFSVPSQEGNECIAMRRVREAVGPLGLPTKTLDNLGTAVAEGTMNAMEHGNRYRADQPVDIKVQTCGGTVAVGITDHGESPIDLESEAPDLEKKLASMQT